MSTRLKRVAANPDGSFDLDKGDVIVQLEYVPTTAEGDVVARAVWVIDASVSDG
jgi:hypothetical protein